VAKNRTKKKKKDKKEKKEKKSKKNQKVAKLEEQPGPELKRPEEDSEDAVNAPAAAPVASPVAAPVASPIAAPGPAPEAGDSPAPAEAASIREDDSKCDAVYEAEYEKQIDMGRSNERAKKEAKAAKNKCMGIQSKGSKQKEDLVWWALALVISGVVLFAIVGAIVHARNR